MTTIVQFLSQLNEDAWTEIASEHTTQEDDRKHAGDLAEFLQDIGEFLAQPNS